MKARNDNPFHLWMLVRLLIAHRANGSLGLFALSERMSKYAGSGQRQTEKLKVFLLRPGFLS